MDSWIGLSLRYNLEPWVIYVLSFLTEWADFYVKRTVVMVVKIPAEWRTTHIGLL